MVSTLMVSSNVSQPSFVLPVAGNDATTFWVWGDLTNTALNLNLSPGPYTFVEYRLSQTSPCRDVADTSYAPADDLVGNPREAAAPDIGAYEWVP